MNTFERMIADAVVAHLEKMGIKTPLTDPERALLKEHLEKVVTEVMGQISPDIEPPAIKG